MAQWLIRSCFCGMFSRSAIFSNINTKRRLSGTFSVIFSMPSVTSASLQSLSLKSIFYSLHFSLILFLFSCLISVRNSIFLDYSIPPPLLHLLLISMSLFCIPLFCHVSLEFFLPSVSSSSGLISPNILCSLQAPFHLFLTLYLFLFFVSASPFPLS